MSGLVINLTCNDEPRHIDSRSGPTGNAKHKRFLKKRRYQEQRGHSNDRQNKFKQSDRNKVRNHQKGTQHRQKEGESSQPPAVFPKFSPSKPELSSYPSSSSTHTPVTNDLSQDTVKKHPPGSGLSPANSQASTHLPRNVGSLFGNPLKYLAIDCEMVGTGPQGRNSELARCSIVAYNGDIVYDKYIRPINPVTDFRTRWSGIRAHHLRSAVPFVQAKKEILKILLGKVVVGHAIHNDLKALSYSHPACLIRDTARIPLLNKKAGLPETQPASLKKLTKALFNVNIQTGRDGHSSVEDAKATMELYKVVEVEWERTLASKAMT